MTATLLSCRRFAANAVRLQLHALAYNLGNFMRRDRLRQAADEAMRWRMIARKTQYCRAKAASFAPTAPTETNHAQVTKSKCRAMIRFTSPIAASRAAKA